MKQKACTDTSIISLYLSKSTDDNDKIIQFFNQVRNNKVELHILNPILIEVFYQLCKLEGKEQTQIILASFEKEIPMKRIKLTDSLINAAGIIKCQHRSHLSYNDSLIIAYCLTYHIPMHTTEKKIKQIPQNTLDRLKIVKYKY